MNGLTMQGKDIIIHKWVAIIVSILMLAFGAGGGWAVLRNDVSDTKKRLDQHLVIDQEYKKDLTERLSRIEGLLEAITLNQTKG